MASVNKVILVGNLGKDPEVRHLEGGSTVCNFPLATSENYKDKSGNRVEQTEWHNIVLWRAQAEFAEKYLKKGTTIFVEGKLRTRSWEDKDKNKRCTTEIIGDNISILNQRRDDNNQASATDNTATTGHNATADDLPF